MPDSQSHFITSSLDASMAALMPALMDAFSFNLKSSDAAGLLLAHTLLWKLWMTARWRLWAGAPGSKQADKMEKDAVFKRHHRAQTNEAEYAPLLVAVALGLALAKVDASLSCSLLFLGQLAYTSALAFLGFPFYIPGALMRYAGAFLKPNSNRVRIVTF